MTLANKITIGRILLIPAFVLTLLVYIRDYRAGEQSEWQRFAAFGIFAFAAASDAVDGFIARRFNQRSELGTYLDPLADKVLLITTLVLLSRDTGGAFQRLPLWFPVLVFSRDAILLVGTALIHLLIGKTLPRPRIVGKLATFFQMLTLGGIMLKIGRPTHEWPMLAAGFFTFCSGVWYIFDGVKVLSTGENAAERPKIGT